MPEYLITKVRTYQIVVEAKNKDEAREIAKLIPTYDWDFCSDAITSANQKE